MTRPPQPDKYAATGFHPLAEKTSQLMDPVLRKKFGLSVELLENWPEIIGAELSENCQPLKIVWPRRREAENKFKPATLIIASEGFTCLKIQHESAQIIQRLNVFFGFCAIDKIKIEQRHIPKPLTPPPARILQEEERQWLDDQTAQIQDENLRASLWRLGQAIVSSK